MDTHHSTSTTARPYKVMRIIARLNVGGPAIHTVLLTERMDKTHYETLLVTGIEGTTEGSMRYLADAAGIQPIVIPEMGREISWRDDFVALWKLIQLIRREKPDIIDTHTAKAGTLGRIAAIIALAGRRKRLFHTFHGHVFHGYFGPRKTRVFIRIEQVLASFTDRLIAVSEITKQELVQYKIATGDKISVIPHGLNLTPFLECSSYCGQFRAELGLDDDSILLGVVARLVPIKAIDLLLRAVAIVQQHHPSIRVAIIGDGELRESLEAHSVSLGLSEIVHFVGYRTDLPKIYADLDIVALSSLNEGLPVSIIEAMASGCTVVSTAVGGVPNLITDNVTGFLAASGDPLAFASALRRSIESQDRWLEIRSRARFEVEAQYDVTRLVADMSALYAGRDRK